jgi:hypothetical protein
MRMEYTGLLNKKLVWNGGLHTKKFGKKTLSNLMTLEEILEEYGQEVLDTYYELFPDKSISKFPDRFCGFVGEYQDFVLDCYHSTGSDELETLEDFMNGVFQEYYYYCEKTSTGFVFYNER